MKYEIQWSTALKRYDLYLLDDYSTIISVTPFDGAVLGGDCGFIHLTICRRIVQFIFGAHIGMFEDAAKAAGVKIDRADTMSQSLDMIKKDRRT